MRPKKRREIARWEIERRRPGGWGRISPASSAMGLLRIQGDPGGGNARSRRSPVTRCGDACLCGARRCAGRGRGEHCVGTAVMGAQLLIGSCQVILRGAVGQNYSVSERIGGGHFPQPGTVLRNWCASAPGSPRACAPVEAEIIVIYRISRRRRSGPLAIRGAARCSRRHSRCWIGDD
jgi:hypothetical protein